MIRRAARLLLGLSLHLPGWSTIDTPSFIAAFEARAFFDLSLAVKFVGPVRAPRRFPRLRRSGNGSQSAGRDPRSRPPPAHDNSDGAGVLTCDVTKGGAATSQRVLSGVGEPLRLRDEIITVRQSIIDSSLYAGCGAPMGGEGFLFGSIAAWVTPTK